MVWSHMFAKDQKILKLYELLTKVYVFCTNVHLLFKRKFWKVHKKFSSWLKEYLLEV